MRRPTVSRDAAAGMVALGWLLLPLVATLGAVNRGPNSTQLDSVWRVLAYAYSGLTIFVFLLPFAYLVWYGWRGMPARFAWPAWNRERHFFSLAWTLMAGGPAVMLLGAALDEALTGRLLFAVLAGFCALGFELFRSLMVAPRMRGFEDETAGTRLSRIALLFLLPVAFVSPRFDITYGERRVSSSLAESVERSVWRVSPAWRDSVVLTRREAYVLKDLFVEEEVGVSYRWFVLRDLQPRGAFRLVAVASLAPRDPDRNPLSAVMFSAGAARDTVTLTEWTRDRSSHVLFGRITRPLPDSVHLAIRPTTSALPVR